LELENYAPLCRCVNKEKRHNVPLMIDNELKKFGSTLKAIRVSHQITQEKLAELTELNIRTVQKIEAGQTNILITTALRLQKALGCRWDELMRFD